MENKLNKNTTIKHIKLTKLILMIEDSKDLFLSGFIL